MESLKAMLSQDISYSFEENLIEVSESEAELEHKSGSICHVHVPPMLKQSSTLHHFDDDAMLLKSVSSIILVIRNYLGHGLMNR